MPNCSQEAAHRAASDAELIAWVDEADQLLLQVIEAQPYGELANKAGCFCCCLASVRRWLRTTAANCCRHC